MPLKRLEKGERMRLMRFVCSFAWADLKIQDRERQFVHALVRKLRLTADEAAEVEEWLKVPPPPDSVDPTRIPATHRQLFLEAARAIVLADGLVHPEERESLALLEELLR